MQPAVIGFDVLLPLPDRLSPQEIIRSLPSINEATRSRLMSLPSNDTLLAASFRRVPVVLGIAALPATAAIGNGSTTTPVSMVAEAGDDAGGSPAIGEPDRQLAELDAAASGRGIVTLVPDDDGVLRHNAAAVVVRERVFPSLAVELGAHRGAGGRHHLGRGRQRHRERTSSATGCCRPTVTATCGFTTRSPIPCKFCRRPTSLPGGSRRRYPRQARPARHDRVAISDYTRRPSAIDDRGSRFMPSCSRISSTATSSCGLSSDPRRTLVALDRGRIAHRRRRAAAGWRLLPLFVGLPALGFGFSMFAYLHAHHLIDPTSSRAARDPSLYERGDRRNRWPKNGRGGEPRSSSGRRCCGPRPPARPRPTSSPT